MLNASPETSIAMGINKLCEKDKLIMAATSKIHLGRSFWWAIILAIRRGRFTHKIVVRDAFNATQPAFVMMAALAITVPVLGHPGAWSVSL